MTSRSPAFDALLIDFDGVLRVWPENDSPVEASHGLPDGAIRNVAFEPSLLERVITGRISDDTWRQEIMAILSARFHSSRAAAAVEEWSRSPGAINPKVLETLSAVRERIRLVLVTNATSRLESDLKALGLGRFFHAVANSSAIGAAKPQAAIFQAALSLAGTSAERALFVDDSAQNVAAARALGIRSALFQGQRSLHELLRSNGVLVQE